MKLGRIEYSRNDQVFMTLPASVADNFFDRFKGLIGVRELPMGEGVLISPCGSIHTFFMAMAIDVVYVNQQGVIVKIVEKLSPWLLSCCLSATEVIEFSAGSVDNMGLQVGDKYKWLD